MREINFLLRSARRGLGKNFNLPHQPSSVARDLFLLSHVYGLADDPRVRPMILRFFELLTEAGFPDLPEHQIRYAMRIADPSHAPILFDEMFKIFSLCDEIHALQMLDLQVGEELYAEYKETLRARFSLQKRDASHAAQKLVERWSKELWWYAENL